MFSQLLPTDSTTRYPPPNRVSVSRGGRTYRSRAGETGFLRGRFPYVQVGSGDRQMVVLPGFGDAMFDGEFPPFAPQLLRAYFSRFLDTHTVTLLGRPRGLADDATIESLAAEHVAPIERELGTVDVLGISMGGMIGLELADRYPDLVDGLVLANSGVRVSDAGRPRVEQLRDLAAERDWARIRSIMAVEMFTDWRSVSYPPAVLSVGRFLQPEPADPADPVLSLDAILDYDGADTLAGVDAPALLVGGERDPLFPPAIQEEMAAALPAAELAVFDRTKHGAFHQRKAKFDRLLRSFLD